MDQQHLIGELGPRGDQRGERAGGRQFVGAAEIGDHPLADRRAVAFVLDDLDVAALAGLLEAEKHGPSAIEHHGIRVFTKHQAQKLCKRGTTLYENNPPALMISMPCKRKGQFTVQVGFGWANKDRIVEIERARPDGDRVFSADHPRGALTVLGARGFEGRDRLAARRRLDRCRAAQPDARRALRQCHDAGVFGAIRVREPARFAGHRKVGRRRAARADERGTAGWRGIAFRVAGSPGAEER